MNEMLFSYKQSSVMPPESLALGLQKLHAEIARVAQAKNTKYQSMYASVYAPFDELNSAAVLALVAQKKQLNPAMLIVVGIGGSHLGAQAVHEAVHGRLYNERTEGIKIYFVDTVDADYVAAVLAIAESFLASGKRIIINVISKSGSTTESIANFECFLALLKRYEPQTAAECVVVTTDHDSPFMALAQGEGFAVLGIPRLVGGRFSIFSAVGLFPLALIGVDVHALLAGARHGFEQGTLLDTAHNPAAVSALVLAHHYAQGFSIHDTFLFSLDLEVMGKWYRQLMGESIGKECNVRGEHVGVGITPTVSLGSTDLHSVGQLYLGGPRDKVTTFIVPQQWHAQVHVPHYQIYEKLVGHIQGKELSSIMHAIVRGVQRAYEKKELPFMTVVLPTKSPFYIGQLLQVKMLEIIYLGYVLQINPFDQPHVELYKQETREILSHE